MLVQFWWSPVEFIERRISQDIKMFTANNCPVESFAALFFLMQKTKAVNKSGI